MEKPVKYKNRKNENLFGMVFYPEEDSAPKRIGIIMSVNAIKYRIGTFRLHTLLARSLCDLGYYVMYFDPSGIGDSEGEFEDKKLFEHYYDIQKGKYSDDISDTIKFFEQQFNLEKILLFGLCGGAISMLIAASKEEKIDGLILLGIPVLLEYVEGEVREKDEASMITSEIQATNVLKPYLLKIIDGETWLNLLMLNINLRNELKVIAKALYVIASKHTEVLLHKIARQRKIVLDDTPASKHPRFNMLFQNSFARFMERRGKILFLFGSLDRVTWVFKSEFQDKVLAPSNPYEDLCEIAVIKDANHIFSAKESQNELKKTIEKWLQNNYPIK